MKFFDVRIGLCIAALAACVVTGCSGADAGEDQAAVTASPAPGSGFASPGTQISLLGAEITNADDVTVTGSRSGDHSGTLEPYSGVVGASFVPDRPFQAGEKVTVETGREVVGSDDGSFSFRVADFRTDAAPPPRKLPSEARMKVRHASFHSRPDLKPPLVIVQKKPDASAAPGRFFISPKKDGPMILDGDGELVYYRQAETTDFRVQSLDGEPVATWWEGPMNAGGYTEGSYMIIDRNYEEVERVFAGNGYKGDLHEFNITDRGTAWLTIYRTVLLDLTAEGGPRRGAVLDSIAQEVDLDTGLVVWEWHSLDHVDLSESVLDAPRSESEAWDYFHINSINEDDDGNLLISGRNTFSVLKVDRTSGEVMWRLGGRKSDFEMGQGTDFSWQHDAKRREDGAITLFDNAANYFGDPTYDHSRGLALEVGEPGTRVELAEPPLVHPDRVSAPSQGSFQTLPGGNQLIGWGSQPFFTEYTPDGEVVSNFTYTARNSSYRTYKYEWEGSPGDDPAIATARDGSGVKAWASWNGDTRTATWRLLGGADENSLEPLAETAKDGFETAIRSDGSPAFLAVEALDRGGSVIGRSPVVAIGELDTGTGPREGEAGDEPGTDG